MHRPDEPLISIREAARRIGLNMSTLVRQVKAGSIRSHEGKVRFSEVLEDRASNIDLSQSRRGSASDASPDASAFGASPSDASHDVVLVDGQALPFAQAQALKETYLARLRRLEFEQKSGALIDRAAAERVFFETARDLRDAWISWPARVSVLLASELGVEARALTEALSRAVHQHLAELGETQGEFEPH